MSVMEERRLNKSRLDQPVGCVNDAVKAIHVASLLVYRVLTGEAGAGVDRIVPDARAGIERIVLDARDAVAGEAGARSARSSSGLLLSDEHDAAGGGDAGDVCDPCDDAESCR